MLVIYVSIWNISKGGENMAKEYKVVRSYDGGERTDGLQNAFKEGWQFERASEYVPSKYYGYIEYILFKEVETADEE
jgi:hypothetical protein